MRRIATHIARGGGTRGLGRSSCRPPGSGEQLFPVVSDPAQALGAGAGGGGPAGACVRCLDPSGRSARREPGAADPKARSRGSPACSTSRSPRFAPGRLRAAIPAPTRWNASTADHPSHRCGRDLPRRQLRDLPGLDLAIETSDEWLVRKAYISRKSMTLLDATSMSRPIDPEPDQQGRRPSSSRPEPPTTSPTR